ncbi:uncharacterized protein [Montipora foliosa]|uniref:uncharacterized protein n=1 Tax=Montipora foliosa TaxID=591990 RepID=UPI0035F21949
MVPTKTISAGASRVTQLTVRKGKLYRMGEPVDAVEMKDALHKFVNWLKAKNKKVVLFAHNANAFDSKRIIYTLMRCNLLNPFTECVAGFVDTLSLFKNILPERKTYSQESLVTDLLGVSYGAHDALEDVRAIQKLVSHVNVNGKEISESSFTVDYALESTKYCVNRATNMHTLQPLIVAKVVSKGMAEKIAGSNLQLCHINLAFQRGGLEGIASILSETINGKARVTRSKRITQQLYKYFKDLV